MRVEPVDNYKVVLYNDLINELVIMDITIVKGVTFTEVLFGDGQVITSERTSLTNWIKNGWVNVGDF